MVISKIVLVFAGLALITQSAWSQQNGSSKHGILGYLDTRTGAFKPLVQTSAESEQAVAAAAAPSTGKLVFNFTINVVSTFSSSEVITCSASASVFEVATTLTIEEDATVVATRSGSKATCTVTIPYSWALASASQDMVGLEYTITASSTTTVTSRLSLHSLPSIGVPANASTTTQSISATI
jgi:hypothetical protein